MTVMSTHPCKNSPACFIILFILGYSINTAAEAVAAGFKHYYRTGFWYHIYATAGSTSRVSKDTVAPATCTSSASSSVPTGAACTACLTDFGYNTGGKENKMIK